MPTDSAAQAPSPSDEQIEKAAINLMGDDPANIHMRAAFVYGAMWLRYVITKQEK